MTWNEILQQEKNKEYYSRFYAFIAEQYRIKKIFPERCNIFAHYLLNK